MSENESTRDLNTLTTDEKLNLLLADMRDVKARLASLEAFAEERSRDTRPMLERIHHEVADLGQIAQAQGRDIREIRNDLKLIHERLNVEGRERFELTARVADLERRPN